MQRKLLGTVFHARTPKRHRYLRPGSFNAEIGRAEDDGALPLSQTGRLAAEAGAPRGFQNNREQLDARHLG
eukprot:1236268-Pyramimonas_sp.AAC.1